MVAANSIVTPKPTHEREEDSRRRDQRGVEWSEKIKEEWIPARDPAERSSCEEIQLRRDPASKISKNKLIAGSPDPGLTLNKTISGTPDLGFAMGANKRLKVKYKT
ncbi:predicted protein [Arabidopsis lyrata subsp. lyrata]|uniref:Predicted protein n=1 Tax=Arabidopsis lyrata subsp. lyrata TaxID=81972 RepID=D7KUC1_ARALL|nr:predicted protein [Arabidopsis lyrata subsp. lyrata]